MEELSPSPFLLLMKALIDTVGFRPHPIDPESVRVRSNSGRSLASSPGRNSPISAPYDRLFTPICNDLYHPEHLNDHMITKDEKKKCNLNYKRILSEKRPWLIIIPRRIHSRLLMVLAAPILILNRHFLAPRMRSPNRTAAPFLRSHLLGRIA